MTPLTSALAFVRRVTLRIFAVAYAALAVAVFAAVLLDCVR